jgi:hypothetical protein
MSDRPTLKQQADAVELATVNQRGHVANISELVERGKRPPHELNLARRSIPGLAAATTTLRALEQDAKVSAYLTRKGLC